MSNYLRASDMIAAALFSLSSCFTLWTINEIGTAFRILKEFFLMFLYCSLLLTCVAWVPLHTALKAHLVTACADWWLVSFLAFLNVADTARQWAPPKFRIQVYDNILIKAQVFCIYILTAKLSNVFTSVHFFTTILHTGYLYDASLCDLNLQMILNALLAL